MHVVATAGHVDHGKSTLVLALTGIDPDRWAEEKARGLTIDLGFAWTGLPSGRGVAFVDVPGHVRFIRNMLAGVGAVDACMFVVAATEGWKPQSEEHLRILELLGVSHGVLALTKVGLVDDEWREAAMFDLVDHLDGTFLQGAPAVATDALDGSGIDDLRAALDEMLESTSTSIDRGRPRLWIDRSFAAKGSGTVVTGTLAGGSLAVGDEMAVEPGGTRVRIRALQSHQEAREKVAPGHRVAVNITGITHDRVARGDALVDAGQWARVEQADCSLTVLASIGHDVSRRGAFVAYIGAAEVPVHVRVLGEPSIRAGATGAIRLRLPVALPLVPGDRYVLRESGRAETVGGGEILEVSPVTRASRARPDRSVDRVVRERGWVRADDLERLTGEHRKPDLGGWVVDPAALAAARERLEDRVRRAGSLGLDVAGLDDRDRLVLAAAPGLAVDGGRARLASARATEEVLADHPWLAAIEAAPFAPPAPDGVDREELREMVRRGLVVETGGLWFARSAVDRASEVVAAMLERSPEGITVAAAREEWSTTRKWALPLLAHLDATGVTRRRGDLRIAGPRLRSATRPTPS